MKLSRFFAAIFAVLGMVLLLGSYGLCLVSRDARVHILKVPQGAVDCSDAFGSALEQGDLTAAAKLMYGQPDLGVDGTVSDPEVALLWEAFRDSVSFTYTGKCYAVENGFARDATVSVLDVAAITRSLPEQTQALITRRVATASALEEIYDEDGQFRQELADQILREALQQSLNQDAQVIRQDVTVKMVNRDGAWWVVPDQALLQVISG